MVTHGYTRNQKKINPPKVYRAWKGMRNRCYNPNYKGKENYSERGITVCDLWRYSFEDFVMDMGEPPTPEHSLDRIDNDGNYCPNNCRWATRKQQQNNNRQNRLIEWGGRIWVFTQLANAYNINPRVLDSRLRIGWDLEKALFTPVQYHPKQGPRP